MLVLAGIVSVLAFASPSGLAGAGTAQKEPIKIMAIGPVNVTGAFPGLLPGAKAAEAAINKDGGIKDPAGGTRKLQVIFCNDKFDANATADCGRQAVSEGVVAVVPTSAFTTYVDPIAQDNIPAIGGTQNGTAELSSKTNYPIVTGLQGLIGEITLARSLGQKEIRFVAVENPNTRATLGSIGEAQAKQLGGITLAEPVFIPLDATDYAQYAAQATEGGAAVGMGLDPAGVEKFTQALIQQGTDFSEQVVIGVAGSPNLQQIKRIGASETAGLFQSQAVWPTTYTKNAGVKKYNNELDALKDKDLRSEARTDVGMTEWASIHLVVELLEKSTALDSASLIETADAAGPTSYEPLPKFDWSKPAYDTAPLSQLRIFNSSFMPARIVDGKYEPIAPGGYVSTSEVFKPNKAGKL